jgi:hypothetical protein
MTSDKEIPAVETVQEGLRLSDLLMVDVCTPVKSQIDEIKVCYPILPRGLGPCRPLTGCVPDIRPPRCSPEILTFNCIPLLNAVCQPIRQPFCQPIDFVDKSGRSGPSSEKDCPPTLQCRPDLGCRPGVWVGWQEPLEDPGWGGYLNRIQSNLAEKLTITELNTVREEVAAIRKEITELRRQAKR